MILFELTGREDHPAYQALQIANGERHYGFLRSVVSSSLEIGRPFLSYKQDQAYERQSAPLYNAYAGQKSIPSCWPIVAEGGFIDWLACLSERISAEDAENQAYYDLKAQQDMALWAFGMLIVTIWIALFTLIGIFLVWRTFVATQRFNKLTESIERPLVNVAMCESNVNIGASGFENKVYLRFENRGRAPAEIKMIYRRWVFFEEAGQWPEPLFFLKELPHDGFPKDVSIVIGSNSEIKFPAWYSGKIPEFSKSNIDRVAFQGKLEYTSTLGDNKRYASYFCYIVDLHSDGDEAFIIALPNVGAEYLNKTGVESK